MKEFRWLAGAVGASWLLACSAHSATLPPAFAPELRRALEDTVSATRVYQAAEVRDPVISAPGNTPPRFRVGDGRAVFRFVVDTTGRIELNTLELEPGSDTTVARPVVPMLSTWRYLPARLATSRAVRQLVELTVTTRGQITVIRLSTDPP